jgi:hypothetical protein
MTPDNILEIHFLCNSDVIIWYPLSLDRIWVRMVVFGGNSGEYWLRLLFWYPCSTFYAGLRRSGQNLVPFGTTFTQVWSKFGTF